jgi:hypothetical protein
MARTLALVSIRIKPSTPTSRYAEERIKTTARAPASVALAPIR